jgi:hypothetical protein
LADVLIVDRCGFAIAVVTGAGGILAGKAADLPQLQVTGFAVMTMLVYAFVLYRSPRFALREDQAGDNLYYVGLLLTLTSLGWALYDFDEARGAQQIVQNFGMALATTIVGLALRVLFNQMRQNLVQIEKESRIELAEAASALRAELLGTVASMNDFRRITEQAMAEAFLELKDVIDKTVKASAVSVADGMVSTGNDVSSRLGAAFDRLEQHGMRFETAASRMAGAVDSHATTLERISSASTSVDRSLSQLALAASAAGGALGTVGEAMAGLQDVQAKLREATEATLRAMTSQTEITTQMKAAMDGLNAQASTAAAKWAKAIDAAVAEMAQKNAEALPLFREHIGALQQHQQKAMEALTETLGTAVEALKAHQAEMATELTKSRSYTLKVHQSLCEMIEELATKLGAEEQPAAAEAAPAATAG